VTPVVTFDEYVRLRGPQLVRLSRLLVRDRHLAEDLVQDVLGRAFTHWDRIVRNGDPEVYLRRMLINANTSWWRRRSSSEVVAGDVAGDVASAGVGAVPGPRDLGEDVVERDAAWRLLARLPAKQRAAVVLRYYEDLDTETIAQILDCSAVTVRTQIKRALATLREHATSAPSSQMEGRR
jgi:RNA polymerase sigma-70 factor (sigma-E family)